MAEKFPLPFVPTHIRPDGPGETPLLFAFRRRELLVNEDGTLPSYADINSRGFEAVRTQYLGRYGESHCYSAEFPPDAEAPSGLAFRDLRMLFTSLESELHAVAGRAVQIVEWDRTHQFCGACAKSTELSSSDRSRACPDCAIPAYPRLAPAMIVAVEREDEILLGRSTHFPAGIFSVLAGFVEPGESAEDAVVREVYEETRVVVDNVTYFGSQAWPYPNSLMLGFTARYVAGEIDCEHDELEDAAWFRYDKLPNTFPGDISISQWLLKDFIRRRNSAD
jgi:NAD+ diphosphatase